MSAITLTQAQTQLDGWLAASTAVQANQRYMIDGRELWRTDAAEIRSQIDYWNGWVQRLTIRQSGRTRARTIRAAG